MMKQANLKTALQELDLGGASLASWANSQLLVAPTFDFATVPLQKSEA
jgi:hypothetical protein